MIESVLAGCVIVLPFVAIVALLVDGVCSALRRKSSALATGHGQLYRVVGAAHHQQALKRLLPAAPDRLFTVRLVPTPDDPYDPHTIAVHDASGMTLAYMPAEDAPSYGPVLAELHARGVDLVCPAKIVGGGSEGLALDVSLDLDRPPNIARRCRIAVHHAERG